MLHTKMRINSERLQASIEQLARYGLNENGGLDRTTFTEAELEARKWLKEQLIKTKLQVRVDEAANIWARRQGTDNFLPVIAFGSHIDTVPNGGKLDGALGVLMALEVMKVLDENQISTAHPLELVSFSAEEPNPFGLSTFGSRAITGKLKTEDIKEVRNVDGLLLTEALQKAGGNPDKFYQASRPPKELAAFLEVHIEQGKRLLSRSISVGVVTAITGIYREEITVSGEANHAGTTLMEDRKDALTASSEMIIALEEECKTYPKNEVVGTIGKMNIKPNAANIIPAEVTFTLEIRGETIDDIKTVLSNWSTKVKEIATKRHINIKRSILLDQPPAPMDNTIIKVMKEQADILGYPSFLLGSMAGHDAAHLASITKSGMLFVPSIEGKSHCPEEDSTKEDIEKVANVLLHTILELDSQLE